MYLDHFQISDNPFKLTPDPSFFYASTAHRRAMATLSYGLSKNEGFIVITGEVGAGKTTLIDFVLSKLDSNEVVVAKINTSRLDAEALLELVAESFGAKITDTRKGSIIKSIFKALDEIKTRSFPIVIIDEVQNLPFDSLEELRMLSNYKASDGSTLQILLVGQPQFRAKLATEDYAQVRQRALASFHLPALKEDEIQPYISHRMSHVGRKTEVFTTGACTEIYNYTGGVPRQINLLCDRLLFYAYLEEKQKIYRDDVRAVANELAEEFDDNAFGNKDAKALINQTNVDSPDVRALSASANEISRSVEELKALLQDFVINLQSNRERLNAMATRLAANDHRRG